MNGQSDIEWERGKKNARETEETKDIKVWTRKSES